MNSIAPSGQEFGNRPRRKQIVWLASEAWDRNNDAYTAGSRKMAAEGAIVLMLESQRVPSFEEVYYCIYIHLQICILFMIPYNQKIC